MSLKDVGSKIQTSAKQMASGNKYGGMKGKLFAILFGAVVGVLVDLGLNYIFTMYVYPMTDAKNPDGTYKEDVGRHTLFIKDFTIFPSQYVTVGGTTTYYMYFDDLILLISTLLMLMTRKWWFVLGYFIGWYSSSMTQLYTRLKLPIGVRDHY